jgi:serine phosphatase RsbU (regulator of sigma subunit)
MRLMLSFVIVFFTAFCVKAQDVALDSIKTLLSKLDKNDTAYVKLEILLGETEPIFRFGYWDSLSKKCAQLAEESAEEHQKYIFLSCQGQSLNNIGFINDAEGKTDKAIIYFKSSLLIQDKIGDKKGKAITLTNLGGVYYAQGKSDLALENFTLSLQLQKEVGDKEGLLVSLNNIGGIYDNQGDISKALEYYLESLKIAEELKKDDGATHALNNIGAIYDNQGELLKALEYYNKCLKLRQKMRDEKGVAKSYNNIANILTKQNKYRDALKYYNVSLAIQEKLNDQNNLIFTLKNIGNVYLTAGDPECNEGIDVCKQKAFDKALECFSRALNIANRVDNKIGAAFSLNGLADVNFKLNKLNEALDYGLKSLEKAKEIGFPENVKVAAFTLKQIYQKKNNPAKALEMYELYIAMKDSIVNDQNRKAAKSQEFKYEWEKREAKLKYEQEARDAIAEQARLKQQIVLIAVVLVLIVVIVFSFLMYKRYKLTQQQKIIIEKQKEEVDKQREVAEQRRQLAEEQKHIIEEKNKEITDSITYASRIQRAMLTSAEYINNHLHSEYFIYYQPKDIVSGDYYWATSHQNNFYLVTADCTGHGVPGAFMSLLNMSFLQENIVERNITEPHLILNEQRSRIIRALNPTGYENSKDGMDCVLTCINLDTLKLSFAAANNALYLVRNGQLNEFKPDKMPVGLSGQEERSFAKHELQLEKGDIIYTFTDGYADQFGGELGKKFLYKKFKELLISVSGYPMQEQKRILKDTMDSWMSNVEQIDDILVIGVKII